jgi:hypothetical protein
MYGGILSIICIEEMTMESFLCILNVIHAKKQERDVSYNIVIFRVRVALEPKCTLTTNSCDNDKIFTFFNASFLPRIKALSVFFL